MIRLWKVLAGSLAVLLVSGCMEFFAPDHDGPNPNPNPAINYDVSKPVLPKTSAPMIWGGYYNMDSSETIYPGKRDTTQSCREYIKQRDSAQAVDTTVSPMPYDTTKPNATDSLTNSDTFVLRPIGYDWVNPYTYINYKPIYQPKEVYHHQAGTVIEASMENPGKVYQKGNYKFVGDINRGVHVYDYTNASTPVEVAFIYLPGNIDVAIKNNTLYANSYSNFLAIDISNPATPKMNKILEKAFPNVYKMGYPAISADGGLLAAWVADTVVECGNIWRGEFVYSMASDGVVYDTAKVKSVDSFGKSGSMSRFALSSDYLYAVDTDSLNIFNISQDANPKEEDGIPIGRGLETIFMTPATKNQEAALYIGANTGMYIYKLSTPSIPTYSSKYDHFTSCDPVVVQDTLAFVTLRSGSFCRNGNNSLDIVNVRNLAAPKILKSYPMQNPHGLAVIDTLLYLCEGSFGFKVFSIANPSEIKLLTQKTDFHAFDVIVDHGKATVIGNNGVYVFDVSMPDKLTELSHTAPVDTGSGFDGGNNFPIMIMPMVEPVMFVD